MGVDKGILIKGVDFVNWAINEGHDVVKMAFDKAYMQRVVDLYNQQKEVDNNDTSENS